MPQRGDNPNEVLFEAGTAWSHRNVDNYYDVDSQIARPVDEVLAALEEEFECPLVHLEFRRRVERKPHWLFAVNMTYSSEITLRLSWDAEVVSNTEADRIAEFLAHETSTTKE